MKKLLLLSLALLVLLRSHSAFSQDDCRAKVEDFVIRYKTALTGFIADPGSDQLRADSLKVIQRKNQELYRMVMEIAREGNRNMANGDWRLCFTREYLNIMPRSDDVSLLQWSSFLFKNFSDSEFISPEFERGLGVHFDVNQGVADVGTNTEGYSFATRLLIAYTFSKHANGQGGRWRIMSGISTYYQDTDFMLFFNPRVEIRITDIGNKLTTLGNLKAIIDGNFGETTIAGGGLGVELHNFGFQLLYQWQDQYKHNHILVGLFYRFRK